MVVRNMSRYQTYESTKSSHAMCLPFFVLCYQRCEDSVVAVMKLCDYPFFVVAPCGVSANLLHIAWTMKGKNTAMDMDVDGLSLAGEELEKWTQQNRVGHARFGSKPSRLNLLSLRGQVGEFGKRHPQTESNCFSV